MDCLFSRLPPALRDNVRVYTSSISPDHVQWAGIAAISLVAVYVGYSYIQSQREAAVAFNVPVPQEVRKAGSAKTWAEIQGQQKKVLEDQVRGVSEVSHYSWSIQCWLIDVPRNGTTN